MQGRGYWTVPLSCDSLTNNTAQGISIFAEQSTTMLAAGGGGGGGGGAGGAGAAATAESATMILENATVWSVKSIWTTEHDCGDNCS